MQKPVEEGRKRARRWRWFRGGIAALTVLLLLSIGGLIWQNLAEAWSGSGVETTVVPVSLAEEEAMASGKKEDSGQMASAEADEEREAVVLTLDQSSPDVNRPFATEGMLPGDQVTQYYCIQVRHRDAVPLLFQTEVTHQTQNLGEELRIRVTELSEGEVLCDLPFSQADGQEFVNNLQANSQEETAVYYRVDVYADTSMGNAFQMAELTADFRWYVTDQTALTSPKTGDTAQTALWVVACLSAAAMVFLLWKRKKALQE